MSNQETAKKWYNNKVLVIILCVVFFPVGLYALWKNDFFSKNMKIVGTVVIAIAVIIIGSTDDSNKSKNIDGIKAATVDTPQVDKLAASEIPTTITTESAQPSNPQVESKIVSEQEQFEKMKVENFKTYILSEPIVKGKSPTIDKYKISSVKATKDFFKKTDGKISGWNAKVISVDMYGDTECDIALTVLPETQVGERRIINQGNEFTHNCTIGIEAEQALSKKYGYKGIKREGMLYNTVKELKEGDEVRFSAKVVDVRETGEVTGYSQNVLLEIQLTEIQKL